MSGGEASGGRASAVVTGATDGIGRATARALARRGFRVIVVGRHGDRVASTVREINGRGESTADGVVADLSSMQQTVAACDSIREQLASLDLLVLNANSIAQERTLTEEALEFNLALGHLSRALMTQNLEDLLRSAGTPQVLSVVGMNLSRWTDDPTMAKEFSGQQALGRWQWAHQMWCREYNMRGGVPMNIFMPGLVKTKILDTEPGRLQRAAVKTLMTVVAVTPETSAGQVLSAVDHAAATGARDEYYSRGRPKGRRDLDDQPDDGRTIWQLTEQLLGPWRRRTGSTAP